MRKFVVTEQELNALADLLNSCTDSAGAILRPSQKDVKRCAGITNTISGRELLLRAEEPDRVVFVLKTSETGEVTPSV
jgi:hypothetical protein